MSQWHREHPDDPGTWDAFLEQADVIRQRQKDERIEEADESIRLRELHAGDPAYDKLFSPGAIRRQEMADRFNDEQMRGEP